MGSEMVFDFKSGAYFVPCAMERGRIFASFIDSIKDSIESISGSLHHTHQNFVVSERAAAKVGNNPFFDLETILVILESYAIMELEPLSAY